MFERLHNPQDIFSYKLGSALTMENTVLEMLGDLEEKAQSRELKEMLSQHALETRQQIANIQSAFEQLGEKVDDSPSPAIEGIEKEGQATIKKTDDELVDTIILAGAAETEHHEIAVYEGLITHAEAQGATVIADLLRRNLEQEQNTLVKVQQATEQLARTAVGIS